MFRSGALTFLGESLPSAPMTNIKIGYVRNAKHGEPNAELATEDGKLLNSAIVVENKTEVVFVAELGPLSPKHSPGVRVRLPTGHFAHMKHADIDWQPEVVA